jgi:hypothetical protein
MLNTTDILETIHMIREENLDIRTVTMGISLLDCVSEDIGRLETKIYDKIMKSAKDGAIILMHDLYANTVIAFERAAALLAEEGYEFVTVSELLGDELEAGKVFSKGKPIESLTVGSQE